MNDEVSHIPLPGTRLLPELEREIFEIAALSRPTGIPKLMLVAWCFKEWVEPLLYRVIFVRPEITKPRIFFEKAVRTLVLDDLFGALDAASIISIVSACNGVTDLVANISITPLLPIISGMTSLRTLGIAIQNLFGQGFLAVDFSHSLFANITHLDVLDRTVAAIPEGLHLIPNLTHLSFRCTDFFEVAPQVLEMCAKLQHLVFLVRYESERRHEACVALAEDPRFVVLSCVSFIEDLPLGVRTGWDHWARAEGFAASKRARTVDRLAYIGDLPVS
ncbi:hypothetical protein B0H17DRAFT_1340081 [Mycena rosella]|uniref:F-box domain-containing protein n=1 Tax=Mycena rosella TaxID=1033263 RepID=A0AAD7BTE2_MYCRO|nr:hypothetical protein B0H17DRAFT_1340081 [Mycena rosella]